jgi:hypothetical protein
MSIPPVFYFKPKAVIYQDTMSTHQSPSRQLATCGPSRDGARIGGLGPSFNGLHLLSKAKSFSMPPCLILSSITQWHR